MKKIKGIFKYFVDKFIENRLKYKYFLSVMIAALIFVLSVFVINEKNDLIRFFDIPSLLFVGILPFFIMCVMFGFSNTRKIFNVPFTKNQTVEMLNESLLFFKMFNRTILVATLLVVIVNCTEILLISSGFSSLNMDSRTVLAVTLISPLYAVLINLTIIIPYNIIIRRQLNKREIK